MENDERDIILEKDDDNIQDYTSADGGIYPYSKDMDLSKIEVDLKEDKQSIFEVLRKFKRKQFVFDPDFQRSNKAWKPEQKSMFIESLILNLPLPPFYFNKDKEGRFVVIDGLQRLTAIIDFFSGHHTLTGLMALPWLNGYTIDKLRVDYESVVAKIEDKNVLYYSIMPSVPMAVIYDIFRRINTGGTSLERQEIRNCIYIGNSTVLLKKMSDNDIFKRSIDGGISDARMKDRESILRCLAFSEYMDLDSYKGDMDNYLGSVMQHMNKQSNSELENVSNDFMKTIDLCHEVLGVKAFRIKTQKSRGSINIAVMESVYSAFYMLRNRNIIGHKDSVDKAVNLLLNDSDYIDSVKTSTNSIKKVKARFSIGYKYIEEALC
jgi:hypothetical protein